MYIESGKDEKDLFLFTVVSEDDDCTCFNESISKQFFFPFKPLDCTKENGFRHFFRKAPPRELWFLLASCFLSVLEAAVMMLLISTSPCYTAAFLWSELKRNKHIKSKEFSISLKLAMTLLSFGMLQERRGTTIPVLLLHPLVNRRGLRLVLF